MCDMLWSDPAKDYGSETTTDCFLHNSARGCSFYYTFTAVSNFLRANNLLSIIRAHEAQVGAHRLAAPWPCRALRPPHKRVDRRQGVDRGRDAPSRPRHA